MDLLAYSPAWWRWTYPRLYALLVHYLPTAWALGYYLSDWPWLFRLIQPWRRCWNLCMARRFIQWLRARPPDVIVTTHFFPADVVAASRQAGWVASRLIVVMTDLFPHRFWLVANPDALVVGSRTTQRLCQQRGLKESRLHALGIPIGARFCLLADRLGIARTLGLDPARRTILIASGGFGTGPMQELVDRLMGLERDRQQRFQLLVVCGYNRRLARHLEQRCAASPMPVRVFGFVDTMDELMRVSDVFVTKAGGITVMEALAMRLPMVFCGTIRGQESLNAAYVEHAGAGTHALTSKALITTLLELFDDPAKLQAMQERARVLGKPQAAQDLVDRLLAHGTS